MRKIGIAILIATAGTLNAFSASAQQYVHGYTRADGTQVQSYYRSTPNTTKLDNYSTRGNVNPYTGATGTVNPYATPSYQRSYRPAYQPTYQSSYQVPVYQSQQSADDSDGGG
jgi:hypothetical protein